MNSIEIIEGLLVMLSPFWAIALGRFLSKLSENGRDKSWPLNGGTF
jgi:hypothetical protein